jgi:hypothetical protein
MHFMNPAHGKHMTDGAKPAKKAAAHHDAGHEEHGGGAHPHSIHIHHAGSGEPHHENPHHVHIHHADGTHEHSEHGNFAEAMEHAHSIGGGEGQDHGFSSGEEMENEDSLGGPTV